jgi:hypothetical protein
MSACMAVRDSYWGLYSGVRGAISFPAGKFTLSATSWSADVSCRYAWRCGIATGGYAVESGGRCLSRLGSLLYLRLRGLRMCHVGVHGDAGYLLGAVQWDQGSEVFLGWEVCFVCGSVVYGYVMSVCMAMRDSYWGLCSGTRGAMSFSAGKFALSVDPWSADMSCQWAWQCGISTGGCAVGSGERSFPGWKV